MPRTSALDCPGVPPIRALTFDSLGLIKVIEARGDGNNQGSSRNIIPKVVERWGEPDSSKCVLAASMDDRRFDPLLAVARKNGQIEILNPLNGDLRAVEITEKGDDSNPIAALHLFRKERLQLSTRSCTLLTCTTKGNAVLRSYEVANSVEDSKCIDSPKTWNVCNAGNILCSAVGGNENYAVFGGKGVELNMWDLDTCTKTWSAKPPRKDSLDIFTPTWFTAATFLNKDDHRKIVAGTNGSQVRLYDISAQRRHVLQVDFRDSAIKSVSEDPDGNTIYFGTSSGDLASVDIRKGTVQGCFLGKCSGSIRSIARHPELPVIASCGLDCYLRFWDIKTRQLLSAVFLKQPLTSVVIDSNFSDRETTSAAVGPPPSKAQEASENVTDDDEAPAPVKRKKKASKESKQMKKNKVQVDETLAEDDEASAPTKGKKSSRESEPSNKLKTQTKKKSKKKIQQVDNYES